MAKTNAQRQRDWRKAQSRVRGKVLRQIWVDPKKWPKVKAAIEKATS